MELASERVSRFALDVYEASDRDRAPGLECGMATEYVAAPRGPGCLVQLLWYVFIGWWLTQIWVAVAWVLLVSIIGIPLGIWMLNRVPLVLALRDPREVRYRLRQLGKGNWVYEQMPAEQYPIWLRAVYFVLVGWWLSAAWMALASLVCSTIIGLPLGIWMFDLVPTLVSLQR
jgi:uncharacterized membrane protein YccF (DUF307 family)